MQNLSYENGFDLHVNGMVSKTDLHMKGFALGLVLKQRQRELGNVLSPLWCEVIVPSHGEKYPYI